MQGKRILITKKDLYKWYRIERESTVAIAKIYNCNSSTICNKLRNFNIPIRSKYRIRKKDLFRLYIKENKSPYFIGKIYGCSFSTITNRLKKFNIPRKTQALARMKYKKFDFSGNKIEKAYLIGFRLGDLRVYKRKPNSETIVAQCHTTQYVQIKLIKNLFHDYGQVTVSKQRDGTTDISCFLNKTFNFLLPKKDKVENWIYPNKKSFCSFMAGYIDAEGNFIINQGRARFKTDSYDRNILKKMHHWLNNHNIISKFRLIGKKGTIRPEGYVFNKNLWRLNVNEANSLFNFINLIKPFILHGKRLKDINICLDNIKKRKKLGTV